MVYECQKMSKLRRSISFRSRVWLFTILLGSSLAVQPSVPKPVEAPLRDLPWSDQINFLHTTDTHGWHAGHLQEASYSADWGDYISFAHHLRKRADEDGSDILLVDTGDKVEGNGLYDSSEPKGKYTYQIFKEQDIDIIVCGNHELYKQNTSDAEFKHIIPHYKDNYIASNIDITDPKTGERVPLAQRFRKFKTKNQGMQIMAFGFLFDFKRSSDHAFVKSVEDAVTEQWFKDAISDRSIDLFVVAGHSAVRSSEFKLIFDEIRKQQWDTPIMFFGGHYHIRDYKRYDKKSFGLASGRYMETIGFQSISGMSVGSGSSKALANPAFGRRYIDNNLYSLQHHSNTSKKSFATSRGKNVSEEITKARHALQLDEKFGCAPQDFWTNRVPYPEGEGSENSIFTWLENDVIPEMVQEDSRKDKARMVLANTGTMRFDIFKGAFTKDTTFLIQPFTNGFRYLPDVEFDKADKLLGLLNRGGQIIASASSPGEKVPPTWMLPPPEQLGRQYSDQSLLQPPKTPSAGPAKSERLSWLGFRNNLQKPLLANHDRAPVDKNKSSEIVPGYTTVDDGGDDGDDTEHSPIDFFSVPNIFQAKLDTNIPDKDGYTGNVDKVDVIFLDFIQPWVLSGLKYLGVEFQAEDTKPYAGDMDFTTMISTWVSRHWNETDC